MNESKLLDLHPQEFVSFLAKENISRFYFVFDHERQQMVPSHRQLAPIADFIQNDKRDFMQHEGLFFQVSQPSQTLQGAFVHLTNRGQAAGGVRYWQYETVEDYVRDGLRLSKGMTRKNALAGLWWGGGKGVMAHNPAQPKHDSEVRSHIYRDYGRLLTSIKGCYVTAEDAGTTVTDMADVFSQTRFTTCIADTLGGSGNPSIPTARGVVAGMEAALEFLKKGGLKGKVVAIQGAGNVGGALIGFLFDKDVAKIVASDISGERVQKLKEQFDGKDLALDCVDAADVSILSADCDILAPCATGGCLNPRTIPGLGAPIICGAANNQLEDTDRDDRLLQDRGITYVPDFLTNRMGIVTCANEQYGYVAGDAMLEQHLSRAWQYSIHQTTLRVLTECERSGHPPAKVAIRLADQLAKEPHPIFGHRGKKIIESLVGEGWAAR